MFVDGKILFKWFIPSWHGTAFRVTAVFSAVDIIAGYVAVGFTDKTSAGVICWISNVNNMKCMAMEMNWMSTGGRTN